MRIAMRNLANWANDRIEWLTRQFNLNGEKKSKKGWNSRRTFRISDSNKRMIYHLIIIYITITQTLAPPSLFAPFECHLKAHADLFGFGHPRPKTCPVTGATGISHDFELSVAGMTVSPIHNSCYLSWHVRCSQSGGHPIAITYSVRQMSFWRPFQVHPNGSSPTVSRISNAMIVMYRIVR